MSLEIESNDRPQVYEMNENGVWGWREWTVEEEQAEQAQADAEAEEANAAYDLMFGDDFFGDNEDDPDYEDIMIIKQGNPHDSARAQERIDARH